MKEEIKLLIEELNRKISNAQNMQTRMLEEDNLMSEHHWYGTKKAFEFCVEKLENIISK